MDGIASVTPKTCASDRARAWCWQVAGWAVLSHTAIAALLFCAPVLSLLCSRMSSAWQSWVLSPSTAPLHGSPEGVADAGAWDGEGFGDGSEMCSVEDYLEGDEGMGDGFFAGDSGGMCMETDW